MGNYEDGIKWADVLKYYGNLDNGISRLRLKYHGEIDNLDADIIGTLSSTNNDEFLTFSVDKDTLPTNTINAVDRVIDADKVRPDLMAFHNQRWDKDIYH